ncbi:MAG: MvaI/BcnI family restriction endonuclease, partial [Bdellovibrionales bacterium]|nr:MvaI/BcnI family restriction endonuclease [Bdellovibrionales bacterium]
MKITEFKSKLKNIRNKGFIRSKRKGPTGIGYTLESELGIEENNIAVPDLGFAELKSHWIVPEKWTVSKHHFLYS